MRGSRGRSRGLICRAGGTRSRAPRCPRHRRAAAQRRRRRRLARLRRARRRGRRPRARLLRAARLSRPARRRGRARYPSRPLRLAVLAGDARSRLPSRGSLRRRVRGRVGQPRSERRAKFASVYATVAHELFHLVQFSYFARDAEPSIPTWILEGTAAALETRANPKLRPRVRDPAAPLVLGDPAQHHGAELRRPAALAAARRRAAAAAAGALPAARRPACRGRGTARRSRDVRADRGEALPAGVPPVRRLGHRRPGDAIEPVFSLRPGTTRRPASRRSPSTTSARCFRAAGPTRSPSRSRADAARLPRP